jgi:hypothetical protein
VVSGGSMIFFCGPDSRSKHFQGILKEGMMIDQEKMKAVKG